MLSFVNIANANEANLTVSKSTATCGESVLVTLTCQSTVVGVCGSGTYDWTTGELCVSGEYQPFSISRTIPLPSPKTYNFWGWCIYRGGLGYTAFDSKAVVVTCPTATPTPTPTPTTSRTPTPTATPTATLSPTPTPSVSLSANPSSGVDMIESILTATVTTTLTNTINYGFWYNCTNSSANYWTVHNDPACGALPLSPPSGTCLSNTKGVKCDAMVALPVPPTQSTPSKHTYTTDSTAKVVIEQSTLSAENRTPIDIIPNLQPDIPSVTVGPMDYCGSGPALLVSWVYHDPNNDSPNPPDTDPQLGAWVEVARCWLHQYRKSPTISY